jgi:hypothetical protein
MSDWEVVKGGSKTGWAPGGSNPVRRIGKRSTLDLADSVDRLKGRLRELETLAPQEEPEVKWLELSIKSTLEFVFGTRQGAEPYWDATQLCFKRAGTATDKASKNLVRALELERGRVRAIILLQQAIRDISVQEVRSDSGNRVIDNPIGIANMARINDLLEQVLGHVEKSNRLSPAEKAQVTGEIRAGVELIKLPRLDLDAADKYLVQPLKFLAQKFLEAVLGKIAEAAVSLICKCLGL